MAGKGNRNGKTRNDTSGLSRLTVDSLLCASRLNFPTRKSYLTSNVKIRGITEELMSEYQYVGFRAIEKPVSEKNLEYMHAQSSRAEITPWSFDNEYHFGDFRGNALEMLRRGYEIHLHYANYGTHKLFIRLPQGLPDKKGAAPYFTEDTLKFFADKEGPGGTLCVEPFYETDDLGPIFDFEELLDRLVPLRAEILDGDLRPLYLAHLAMCLDYEHDGGETTEGPVPSGLEKLTDAQAALAEFYGLGDALITAAAKDIPLMAIHNDLKNEQTEWLKIQSQATKDEWLLQLISDSHSTVRPEILAKFRKNRKVPAWPTYHKNRTIAQLEAAADEIRQAKKLAAAKAAARQRAKKLASMAVDPEKTLLETEKLVKNRSTDSYREIAKLLSDLRESLAETDQIGLAETQAEKLKKANPTLRTLHSELRKKGLITK
jgi:hypothetical protein